jgi:hypothetical protein
MANESGALQRTSKVARPKKATADQKREPAPLPEIGSRCGKLVVQEITTRRVVGNRGVYLVCLCDCGQKAEVSSYGFWQSQLQPRKHYKHCGQCGGSRGPLKVICAHGHDTTKWRRTPSGTCRGCTKEQSLRSNYGLSLIDYESLWRFQDGKCAVCDKPLGDFFGSKLPGFFRGGRAEVDHTHGLKHIDKRNTVRGLLCGGRWAGCNRKLGRIDHIEWLERVLLYLKNPPAKQALSLPDFVETP